MKHGVIIAMIVALAHCIAQVGLTREQIQAAIAVAPKDQLGDSPLPAGDRQFFYGSFNRDIRGKYLQAFESFPTSRSLQAAFLCGIISEPSPLLPKSDSDESK